MKYRVSDLEGALLDAAVAKASGLDWRVLDAQANPLGSVHCMVYVADGPFERGHGGGFPCPYDPSKSWSLGGPIIERERIALVCDEDDGRFRWTAQVGVFHGYIDEPLPLAPTLDADPYSGEFSRTPLVAAMRAYVASRFGHKVELP